MSDNNGVTDEPGRSSEADSTPRDRARRRPTIETSGASDTPTPWVGIVANRGSGSGRGRRLVESLVHELGRQGLSAEVAWTPSSRSMLVERAGLDGRCRCLVAVGGDGTVSALLNERPGPPLSVMPAGTENLVARHFGLRCDPRAMARTIAAGRTVPVDVAQAGGRRFLLMAGFGFDAEVVARHHRGRITRAGQVRPTSRMAYVAPILHSSVSYRFPLISVRILDAGAEEVVRGTTVFIFNLPRYALGLPFVPVAEDDDGWLDLVVFRRPGPFTAFFYLCKVFCGIHLRDATVYYRRVRKVKVTASAEIPVQLDGDPAGYLLAEGASSPVVAVASTGTTAACPDTRLAAWDVEILPSGMSMVVPPSRVVRRAPGPPLVSDGPS